MKHTLPRRLGRQLGAGMLACVLVLPGCASWLLGADSDSAGPTQAPDAGDQVVPTGDGGSCPTGRKRCGDVCALYTDPAYGCLAADCTPCVVLGGAPVCTPAGACGVSTCNAGRADCDGQVATGCEAELSTNPAHCGACNKACTGTQVCSQGQCGSSCAGTETQCGQSCVDTSTNAAHCGTCGNACTAPTAGTGTVSCVAKECKIACGNGFRLTADQKNCEPIPAPTCGNGARDAGETCDDSNTAAGDGCSATCQAEPLYVCTGAGPGSCVLAPAAWAQQAYVKASNTGARDQFGKSVALSADGNTLAVGANSEDSAATGVGGDQSDNGALVSGAVYVFKRTGDNWTQESYLKASNTGVEDRFGWSVALSADGNTLAVGAYGEDSAATGLRGNQSDNNATDAGAVYVFKRTGATWAQEAYVKASNTDSEDRFGWSVALSADGNTLAVGARLEDSAAAGVGGNQADDSASNAGAVYMFKRTGSTWAQEAYVKASNTGADDQFACSVALSADGNTLAVGATGDDSAAAGIGGNQADNSASNTGAVYVFKRTGSTWAQEACVKASNTGAYDQFGWSVALSADGNTLAVGAYDEDSAATGVGGNQADNSASNAGAVYVFKRTGATWAQEAYVKASNTGADDEFGCSVALSADGNTLAVGAFREDSSATGLRGNQSDNNATDAGAVYVFKRTGATWAQEAYVKASNTSADAEFGLSVAVSTSGNTLAGGAYREDSSATGVGGNQADNGAENSGAVYVFVR